MFGQAEALLTQLVVTRVNMQVKSCPMKQNSFVWKCPHDNCKQVLALSFHPGSGVFSGGWGRETSGPRRFGCSTQCPLLGAYTPTLSQAKGKRGAKGKIRGKSHFLTPWSGTEEAKWTGKVTGAFPFHTPSPVLYK